MSLLQFYLGDDIVDADTPCLKQMINCYDEYKTTVLGVQEVAKENVDKYGILDVKHIEDRVYKVKDMVEKPAVEEAPSNIAILLYTDYLKNSKKTI